MLNTIWTYLKFGKYYCGVEHTTKKGNPIVCTLLKNSKNKLDIQNTFSALSVEELAKKLPKKQHVSLILNDTNVLSKEIESQEKNPLKLVHKAFPNINLKDFYYEILDGNHSSFISLCRKEHVDSLINNYTKHNISVINFTLGNTSISSIQEFISKKNIRSSNAIFTINEGSIVNIKTTKELETENYNINGLEINNNHILSLSGILQKVLHKNNPSNFEDKEKQLLNAFFQSRFFNQFLKFSSFFILALLFVNFLFFNNYFQKINELQLSSAINNSSKERLIILNESVNKKQKMTEDMLYSSASKSSFYVDAITNSLPNSILLHVLNYQPLEKRIKENKPIILQENIIIVSGESTSSYIFSDWLNTLESMDWIKSTEIIDYKDISDSKSSFSIKIILNNE